MTIETMQANRDKYKVNSLHWRIWDRKMILTKLEALMEKDRTHPIGSPMTTTDWCRGVDKILREHDK